MLVTVIGAVREPSVLEIRPRYSGPGHPDARQRPAVPLQALLLGGYFGGWARAEEVAGQPFSAAGWPAPGPPGRGLIAALPADACGLAETAGVIRYLADSSAGQCGPCLFGLDAIADGRAAGPRRARWAAAAAPLARPGGRRGRAAIPTVPSGWCAAPAGLRVRTRPARPGWCCGTRPDPVLPVPPGGTGDRRVRPQPHPARPVLRVDAIACAGRGCAPSCCRSSSPWMTGASRWSRTAGFRLIWPLTPGHRKGLPAARPPARPEPRSYLTARMRRPVISRGVSRMTRFRCPPAHGSMPSRSATACPAGSGIAAAAPLASTLQPSARASSIRSTLNDTSEPGRAAAATQPDPLVRNTMSPPSMP